MSIASRQILKGSFFLFIANASAGTLHYLYQLRAASHLTAARYGVLNSWMAYLSIAFSVGTIAQIASNFFPIESGILRFTGAIILLFSAISAMLLNFLFKNNLLNPVFIALIAISLGIAYHYLLGQFQGMMRFHWMGASMVIAAALKIAFTYWPTDIEHISTVFYFAFPFSFAFACAFQSIVIFFLVQDGPLTTQKQPFVEKLPSVAILAFAMALLPQIDLLNIRFTQSDETVGMFSRSSLFAKAIYFAAVSLLQVTLPFHVKLQNGQLETGMKNRIQRIERFGLGLCIGVSFIIAYFSPFLSKKFLGFDLSHYQTWVLLSCLSLTAIYGQLQKIQLLCTLGKWKPALTRVAMLSLGIVACWMIQPTSVTHYLIGALIFYSVLNFWDSP